MSRRSDYFSTMLGSNFQEGSTASEDILEIQVADVQPEVLYAALRWVYTDRVDADMPAEQLLQVNHLYLPTCCRLSIQQACKVCMQKIALCVLHPYSCAATRNCVSRVVMLTAA